MGNRVVTILLEQKVASGIRRIAYLRMFHHLHQNRNQMKKHADDRVNELFIF
jgi:hypothetical protein